MKKIIIPVLSVLLFTPAAFAEDTDVQNTATKDQVTVEQALTGGASIPSQERANEKNSAPGRRSSYEEHEQVRATILKKMPTVEATETAKSQAAIRASVTTSSSSSSTASDANSECGPGEVPSGSSCVTCDQKNNPGVVWNNPGKDCTISECVNEDYELVSKTDGTGASCVKKCDVWGGTASKKWNPDIADWSACGTGSFIECDDEYMKTNEQTSASGMRYYHCIPEGTLSGTCKRDESTKICSYSNIKAQQKCENGYWSLCTINRICEKGYQEANRRDVYTVVNSEDKRMSVFDCEEKETVSFKWN